MKLAKGIALLGILLLAVAALSGCESAGEGKVLRVGTEATFPPFETTDEQDNIIGFDIDIINYIAEDNGWEIEVVHLPFDSLIESLATDKLDIVVAAMTIREDRMEKVLFSDPYFDAAQTIAVRDDESRDITIDTIVDLNAVIAVQLGTTGSYEAEAIYGDINHANIKQFPRANEAFMELKSGRVDCVIIDKPVAENYIAALGGMKILGQPFTNEQYGIAVQKDNTEMAEKINASLVKMKSNGEYDSIFEYWFGE